MRTGVCARVYWRMHVEGGNLLRAYRRDQAGGLLREPVRAAALVTPRLNLRTRACVVTHPTSRCSP